MNPKQVMLTLLIILEMNGVITYGEYQKIKENLGDYLTMSFTELEELMPKRRKRKKR